MGSPRKIERAGCARFVHGERCRPITNDADLVAGRLRERLADDEAQVFGRMMPVDLDVARGANAEVDEPMTSDLLDHVGKKGQGRLDVAAACSVEIEGDLNAGFRRIA